MFPQFNVVIPARFASTKLEGKPLWIIIGVYAYRVGFLNTFTKLPVCELETREKLEQLRTLWKWVHHSHRTGHRIARTWCGHRTRLTTSYKRNPERLIASVQL
jgi:CMP-2-keto-3-deoxyoctulosonic acid synthetase